MIQNEVGFIGLGNMGAHMVRNLMKKNYKAMVFDINDEAVKAAVQDGKQTYDNVYSQIAMNISLVFCNNFCSRESLFLATFSWPSTYNAFDR